MYVEMTVAITIHLFQAIYTSHSVILEGSWEIATYISVMVNGRSLYSFLQK